MNVNTGAGASGAPVGAGWRRRCTAAPPRGWLPAGGSAPHAQSACPAPARAPPPAPAEKVRHLTTLSRATICMSSCRDGTTTSACSNVAGLRNLASCERWLNEAAGRFCVTLMPPQHMEGSKLWAGSSEDPRANSANQTAHCGARLQRAPLPAAAGFLRRGGLHFGAHDGRRQHW